MHSSRTLIQQAKKQYEETPNPDADPHELSGLRSAMSGQFEEAVSQLRSANALSEAGKNTLAWTYIQQGNDLSDQAETKSGEEADRLFAHAGEKYAAALEIKPDKHDALNNWGVALGNQAETKSGEEADRLFAHAGEKYAAALEIKPDEHEALSNLAATIVQRYHLTSDLTLREQLLKESLAILADADAKGIVESYYNLACVYALKNDGEHPREYLAKSAASGKLPTRADIEADNDFESVRNEPWFSDFLNSL